MEHGDRPSRDSRAWLVAAGVLTVLLLALLVLEQDFPHLMVTVALVVAAAVAVTVWALLRTRADRLAYEERLTEWAAEKAAQAERLRIARDLHDLASHGLGLMTVRAATANLTAEEEDAERRRALSDIERLGRETTTELRRMLALLRTTADTGATAHVGAGGRGATADTSAPLRPTDSLSDLPGIIDGARQAGLQVTVEHGDLDRVPAGVQLTVCATVREALANTLRYAGPTTARVTLGRARDTVDVDVRDGGPVPGWRPRPGTGNGLTGLRERLSVHGGTLTAGPDEGGFRLLARIPEEAV